MSPASNSPPSVPAALAPRIPYRVVLSRHAGSHSFGLALTSSDEDWSLVYAASPLEHAALRPPRDTVDGHGPDFTAHEIGHWSRLVLKGNPSIVEDLLDPAAAVEPAFEPFRRRARDLVSRRTVEAYLGYARAQLHFLVHKKRLHTAGGAYNVKWAVHLLRLLYEARRLARGELPLVRLPESERGHLLEVRHGRFAREAVEDEALAMAEEIESLKPWPWPEDPPEALVGGLLNDFRRAT